MLINTGSSKLVSASNPGENFYNDRFVDFNAGGDDKDDFPLMIDLEKATEYPMDSGADLLGMKDPHLLREVLENMQYLVRILDLDHNIIYMNRYMREQFGNLTGKHCHEVFHRMQRCESCVSSASWNSGKPEVKDIELDGRYFKLMSSPVQLESGQRFSIEMFYDITEQRHLEEELLSHYRKLTAELNFARNIQRSILPEDGNYWNTFKLSALYLPAEVLGGDLFDIIRLNKDKTLLYIADVSGHGVHTSMLTMFLREVVRGKHSEAAKGGLRVLMDSMMEGYLDLDIDPEIYLCVLLCCYNRSKRELSILNAGHNCFPLIVRNDGTVDEIAAMGMPISKLGNCFENEEVTVSLDRGERLVLYTDGIIEEFNIEEQKAFGAEGVKAILHENIGVDGQELAMKIVNAARDFSAEKPKDDRAIMIADVL
ncbi:MAG: SpoIIE family protein phosphatase [Clostridiales Family XIII bacterium]|jgi:sigma-B regulation protein RsbU (phosphoserine phosphatase)|nr:SpoIIE family protein phosphatase [Clostridiales Family XIII bacterium]